MAFLSFICSSKWCTLKTANIFQAIRLGTGSKGDHGTVSQLLCRSRTPCQVLNARPRPFHTSVGVKASRPTYGKGSDATRLILEHEYSIQKDTLLFRYDKPRYFRVVNAFAISQLFFWTYLSHFAFTMMRNVPISEEDKNNSSLPWWKKINFGRYKNAISVGCVTLGWGTMVFAWLFTARSVRFLMLKKGGKNLLFVTFSPFSRTHSMVVPLEHVSARQSRVSSSVYLPLKVKGRYMNYILDMQGEFLNTKLFDYSAGLKRNWD